MCVKYLPCLAGGGGKNGDEPDEAPPPPPPLHPVNAAGTKVKKRTARGNSRIKRSQRRILGRLSSGLGGHPFPDDRLLERDGVQVP